MVVATRPRTVSERRGEQLAGSAAWYERATEVFPSGVTHETRFFQPFPIYIDRAEGSRKWDVDGNEYVDYIGGHGALLLGHGHPALTAAATEQLQRGTHYGASHELEVRWAELVTEIVPSAEQVRFHSSGTEATMMAMRLARAFTGKDVIVKMQGHFPRLARLRGVADGAALRRAGLAGHSPGRPGVRRRCAGRGHCGAPGRARCARRRGRGDPAVQRYEHRVFAAGPRPDARAGRHPDFR